MRSTMSRCVFVWLAVISGFGCLVLETLATENQEGECTSQVSVPGLLTPHPQSFTPVPKDVRRVVCVTDTEWVVIRAFEKRGWKVIRLDHAAQPPIYWDCHQNAQASITWLKNYPLWWQIGQPWMRMNWLPFQTQMTHKGHFQRNLIDHARRTGRNMPFVPDSFLLPADRERLLLRLQPQSHENPEGGGGDQEPWVIKLSATDCGTGIAILGPNSPGVQLLNRTLIENENPDDYMMPLREALVLHQDEDDPRLKEDVEEARQRSLAQNDDIVVQRYICHELAYQGRKFDLRLYYLVASVDPLVVYYHDGSLRVSLNEYNDQVFASTHEHLTNLGHADTIENCTVSLEDFEIELKAHVAANPSRFPTAVASDPLGHIRNQAKLAIAELVAATRTVAFHGIRGNRTNMENYFSLLGGDFIVDEDLHVWMTEAQTSPGFGHETKVRKALYDRFIPSAIDIVTEIIEKQEAGLPIFPIMNTGDYELIYTDDYIYTYDFKHKEFPRGPC